MTKTTKNSVRVAEIILDIDNQQSGSGWMEAFCGFENPALGLDKVAPRTPFDE